MENKDISEELTLLSRRIDVIKDTYVGRYEDDELIHLQKIYLMEIG